MSRPGAATAAGRSRTVRHAPAPRVPRRVSGPARPRATRATPAHATRAGVAPRGVRATSGGAGVAVRVAGAAYDLSTSRWMDRLVRSRLWIGIIAVGLIGLVAMQVSLLKLNAGVGRAVESAATLERQNSALRMQVSRLSSGERIQQVAARLGMVMPAPDDVRYLRAGDLRADGRRAAELMRAPDPPAPALVASAAPDPVAPALVPDPRVADPAAAATAPPAETSAPVTAPTETTPEGVGTDSPPPASTEPAPVPGTP